MVVGVFFWSKWSYISLGSEGKLTLNDEEDEDENARSTKNIKNTVEKARFQLIERTVVVAHSFTVFPPVCCFFTIFVFYFSFFLCSFFLLDEKRADGIIKLIL